MSFYCAFQVFKEKAREAVFPSLIPSSPWNLHEQQGPAFLSSSPGARRTTAKHRGSKTIHLFKICWTLPAGQVPGGALMDTAPTAYCRDRYEIECHWNNHMTSAKWFRAWHWPAVWTSSDAGTSLHPHREPETMITPTSEERFVG